jgi:L-threonylcarbamoyladenylate synthase
MIYPPSPENIQILSEKLLNHEVVALPTETVYGFAGLATSDSAIAEIYAQKNRPQFNPLIIHGSSLALLKTQVEWNPWAEKLSEKFWPGPVTFVLPKKSSSNLSLLALAGLETVAIRIPQHPWMRAILDKVGLLAAPSANPSGAISPTCAQDVEDGFGGRIPILEGGQSDVGVESTIIDLSGQTPQLLRPGGIPLEDIEAVLGPVLKGTPISIKAPGQLESHYAPEHPLVMNVEKRTLGAAYLAFGTNYPTSDAGLLNLSPNGDLKEAASNLFSMMRALDREGFSSIEVAPIPETGLGLAINDRLRRAAAPR